MERRGCMNIFLKYLLKSTLAKKGRSLLLIITIAISAALLIASAGAADSGIKVNEEKARMSSGNYNILIQANKTLKVPYFSKDKLLNRTFKKSVGIISADGYLSKNSDLGITINGVESKDYKKLPNMKILKQDKLESLTGNKIIISEKTSKMQHIKLGSTIKVNIRGRNKSFKVYAIAETSGGFTTDCDEQFSVVTNRDNVSGILGVGKLVDSVLAQTRNNVNINSFIKNFNKNNSDCSANLVFDKVKYQQDSKSVTLILYFMLLIVVIMSSFIIYSCFKLIIIERTPVIGTFLSQGETRGGIVKLLLGESVLYGIFGGSLAMLLGAVLLYVLAYLQNNFKQYGIPTKVDYNANYFIIGFAFAIIVSLVSALLPTLATRKVQIKDIILNKVSIAGKKSKKLTILGVILLFISIILSLARHTVMLSLLNFFLFIIGAVILVPVVTKVISNVLIKMFENKSAILKLALNNLRTSKVLLNNIRLVVIGMTSVILILSLTSSFINVVLGMARDYNEDITIYQGNDPIRLESVVNKSENVKEIIKTYFVSEGKIKGSDMVIPIGGINPDTFKDFNNYFGIKNKDEFYNKLKEPGRNMAISESAAKQLKKSIGDVVTLVINNKEASYKITGTFNVKLSPEQILINERNIKKDFGVFVPDSYALRIDGDASEFKKSLQKELKGTKAKVVTFEEDVENSTEDFKLLMDVLLFFSFMTAAMGVFGIINNVGVSFIQRKKEFAVFSSVGMTTVGNGLMILLEGIFTAVFSIFIGGIISYIEVNISNNIFELLGIKIPIDYNFEAFAMVGISILIVMVLSSFPSIFKNSKMSVVTELKYE
jgi:putative ABC transport system permease protein